MTNVLGHLRYAARQFRNSPVFTATAVLTLAIGIGGTTAIFSLIHAVMLRSLPVAEPASLYRIGDGYDCCVQGGPQDRWGMYSYPLFERLKENLPEFEELAAFQAGPNRMSVRRQTDHVGLSLRSEYVTGNYFSTFGIKPYVGRMFNPSDDTQGSTPVAVLSFRTWQTNYGSDPSVVGSSFVIEGHPFTVVGIAPPGFYGETLRTTPPEVWIPLHQEPMIAGDAPLLPQPISAWLRVIGRIKPGANLNGVAPRLTTVLRQWMEHDSGFPPNWQAEIVKSLPKQFINIVPAGNGVAEMKEDYGRSLQILLAVCALVLLIACANVANLLLARAAARRSQTAVRMAVGASRRQIIIQALLESVLLAVLGGIGGIIVSVAASRLLVSLAFRNAVLQPVGIVPSLPVLGFAFALSLLTGVIFGTVPAWFATRTQPIEALRGGRTGNDGSKFARRALLILQATMSVVLVAGATMLTRSLANLEHQDLGYQVENRVLVAMNSPAATYTPARLTALYRELELKLRQLPGAENVGLALYNPLTDNWGELIMVQGRENTEFNEQMQSSWDRVSTHYLETLGQPIVKGRGFTDADNENTANVAVVNETFAKRFFPNDDPIDKFFGMDIPKYSNTFRIIGVVKDGKYTDPQKPARPMFYAPLSQYVNYDIPIMKQVDLRSHFVSGIVIQTRTPAGQLEPMLRKALAEVDSNLTITRIRSMQEQVSVTFDQERAVATLASLFGIVALLLAAIGLYGVTAYTVAQRTNEIGVRMALGADRGRIIGFVLRGAFRHVAVGLLIGLPLAIGVGRLLAAQLYGVKAWDALALASAALSLGGCALIASMVPALRAAAIQPMNVLRAD